MYKKLALFGVFLALIVIVFGAYVRLSDAGLGCPDWPGCYGKAVLADTPEFKSEVEQAFPGYPYEPVKAWKVLTYRYFVWGLGVVILLLAASAPWNRRNRPAVLTISIASLMLVVLQAALGMWVVQWRTMLLIDSDSAYLMIDLITFWLLFALYLRTKPDLVKLTLRQGPVGLARASMWVVVLQVALGVWTSTNLPAREFPSDVQLSALWLHRAFGVFAFVFLMVLVFLATAAKNPKPVRRAGLKLCIVLLAQTGLGIVIVQFAAPLWAEILHSAFAALLMMPLISISFYGRFGLRPAEIPAERAPLVPEKAPVPLEKPAEEVYVEPAPESLYLRLKSQLKRTRSGLGDALAALTFGSKNAGDDLLEDIEATLLMADIGIDATTRIVNHLAQSLERHQLRDADALTDAVKRELLSILEPCALPLSIPKQDEPFVILVVGVNGVGKTTTIGKLAKRLQAQGHSVMLAAGDTFRAAAVEQLQTWGERNNIHVVAQHTGADSASVIYDGLQSAKAKGVDVLIADTAGRLHTKSNLMEELKKVRRIMGKLDPNAPHEVLLVIDAGTGQNALSQAKQFNDTVALTGLVLTKLDGTAKGGVIFALAKQLGIPIRFIGVGEGIDDLQDFHADAFVEALFARD